MHRMVLGVRQHHLEQRVAMRPAVQERLRLLEAGERQVAVTLRGALGRIELHDADIAGDLLRLDLREVAHDHMLL